MPMSASINSFDHNIPSNPYFTVRDRHVRLFVCRVYQEDQLQTRGLFDNDFDEAYKISEEPYNQYNDGQLNDSTDDPTKPSSSNTKSRLSPS